MDSNTSGEAAAQPGTRATYNRLTLSALLLVVLAAPTMIGGVHAPVQVGLSAAMLAVTALYLVGGGKFRLEAFCVAMLVAVGATALQLAPLPAGLVALLSPAGHAVRADLPAGAARWMPLTLDVPATTIEVCKGLALVGVLTVASGLGRSRGRAHSILMAIALYGGALATLSFLQRALHVDILFGFYHPKEHPGSGYFGTFVAGNHAASLFALAALISAGLAIELADRRRWIMAVAGALSLAGLFSTTSRGGLLGFAVGGFFLLAVPATQRFGPRGWVTALLALVCASGVALAVDQELRGRLTVSDSHEIWSNQKTRGWWAGVKLARQYAWTGVGRGVFEAPVASQRSVDEGVRLAYPENIIVQSAAEWGVPLTLCLLLLLARAGWQLRRHVVRLELGVLAAALAVLAVALHELADFGSEMLGVSFPTVAALGVVVGRVLDRTQEKRTRTRTPPGPLLALAGLGWAGALVAGWWAAGHTLEADWSAASLAVRTRAPDDAALVRQASARHPASSYLALLSAQVALVAGDSKTAMHEVNRALRLEPANLQAHHLAARLLVGLGFRSQAALELRLASGDGKYVAYDEAIRLLGNAVLDAVPQRPEDLFRLGGELVRRKRAPLARAALQRAVSVLSPTGESGGVEVRRRALETAVGFADAQAIHEQADGLVALRPDAASYAQAARALDLARDAAAADKVIDEGIRRWPNDAKLPIYAVQRRLTQNDVVGARALLRRVPETELTLADRQRIEELSAQVAEREGDTGAAILARSRAKMLAHKIQEIEGLPK